jgi:hypothetical protein
MTKPYGYWICTVLLALWLTPSGVLDIMRVPGVIRILEHLGYPAYVGLILGVGKVLGIAAIFYPRTRVLREWAYAGITFDLLGAFISHSAVHDPIGVRIVPLVVLGLAAGSYFMRPEQVKLRAVPQPVPAGSLSAQ